MPLAAPIGRESFDPAPLLDLVPGQVAYVDQALRYRYANLAHARRYGSDPAGLVGRPVRDVIGASGYASLAAPLRRALRGEAVAFAHAAPGGEPARATCTPDRAAGHVRGVVLHIADADPALARTEARLALTVDAIRGGLWHVDVAERRFECSPQLARLLTSGERTTLTAGEIVAMIDRADRDRASFLDLVEGRAERKTVEYHVTTPFGRRRVVCDARLVRDGVGVPVEVVGLVRDVTAERARQRAAELQAETDPLTGLLNRRGLERRIAALRHPAPLGVAVVDLDRFKLVNDTLGHHAGDAVLVEAAARLRALVRNRDLVARLGGDEFLLALPGVDDEVLGEVAERTCKALTRGFDVGDGGFAIGASVGVALRRCGDESFAATVAAADRALYRAKAAGAGAWAAA